MTRRKRNLQRRVLLPANRLMTSVARSSSAPRWLACLPAARQKRLIPAPEECNMGVHVSTTVNGDHAEFTCAEDEVLLDVLRNRLGLSGAKEGCGTGDCGACSVILDGRLVCSCLVLGAEMDGKT